MANRVVSASMIYMGGLVFLSQGWLTRLHNAVAKLTGEQSITSSDSSVQPGENVAPGKNDSGTPGVSNLPSDALKPPGQDRFTDIYQCLLLGPNLDPNSPYCKAAGIGFGPLKPPGVDPLFDEAMCALGNKQYCTGVNAVGNAG